MIEITLKPDSQKPRIFILENLHNLESDPGHWRLGVRSHAWRPPTDVYETEELVVVRVEIAGMPETGISITLDGRLLSIRGFRSDKQERRAYHQLEIRFGEFISEVDLPYEVDAEKIEAVYQGGILRVILPKVQPKHVQIKD